MRFGKIEYLNLLVFDVFAKGYPMSANVKAMLHYRKSYPAKLSKDFLFKRIDAGFISSIAGELSHRKGRCVSAGIIGFKEVWSVLLLPLESSDDYQSASSNALCKVLKLKGKVIIGDRALQHYYKNQDNKDFIDMSKEWYSKTRLPFVFGRFCVNGYFDFYTNLAKAFNKALGRGNNRFKGVKIPHYIITKAASKVGVDKTFALSYLEHIHYTIGHKEIESLERFYRELRLNQIKQPSRF